MSIERKEFVFDIPVDDIKAVDEVDLIVVPLPFRTLTQDREMRNGGVLKSNPYTEAQHRASARWRAGEGLLKRIESGETNARILIGEGALRHFGNGNHTSVDLERQAAAVQHLTQYALGKLDIVRLATFGTDTRGVITPIRIVTPMNGDPFLTETHSVGRTRTYHDEETVARNSGLFDEVWNDSLKGEEARDFLEDIADELRSKA